MSNWDFFKVRYRPMKQFTTGFIDYPRERCYLSRFWSTLRNWKIFLNSRSAYRYMSWLSDDFNSSRIASAHIIMWIETNYHSGFQKVPELNTALIADYYSWLETLKKKESLSIMGLWISRHLECLLQFALNQWNINSIPELQTWPIPHTKVLLCKHTVLNKYL